MFNRLREMVASRETPPTDRERPPANSAISSGSVPESCVRVGLAFTAFTRSRGLVVPADFTHSSAFAVRPNPGANKRVGADPSRSIVQRELVPTNRFRYELLARIPGLVGQRLPFDIELAGQTVSLNVKLRQFPPVGLRTTVSLKHIAVNDANLARTLIGLQRVSQDDPMAAVMRRSLGMMVDLHHRRYTPVDQPSLLCASHIELPEGTPVRPWVEEHTRELVGTLIRTEPADLTKRIVSKIINECDEINEKISATYTLSRVPA